MGKGIWEIAAAALVLVAAGFALWEHFSSSSLKLPCLSSKSCSVGIETINLSMNNTATSSTFMLNGGNVSLLSGSPRNEVTYNTSTLQGTIRTESTCWESDFTNHQILYLQILEVLAKYGDEVDNHGKVPCPSLLCNDTKHSSSDCNCSSWSIKGNSITVSKSKGEVSGLYVPEKKLVYRFGDNYKIQPGSVSLETSCIKPEVQLLEKPQWWVEADNNAHVIGYDGGVSVSFSNDNSLYWLFGDTMLDRADCSRVTYGPGISSSALKLTVSDSFEVTRATYTPTSGPNGCAWFAVDVDPTYWRSPYGLRAWPSGGLSIGDENVIFFNGASANHDKSIQSGYFAASNSTLNESFVSPMIKIPVNGEALRMENSDAGYVYFVDRYTPYGAAHYLRLARVKDEDYQSAEKYEFFSGRNALTGDIVWKGEADAFLTYSLLGKNPQASVMYHQPSSSYFLLTSSASNVYLSQSQDLAEWTIPINVYDNPYPNNCFMYCAYWHADLSESSGNTFYFTTSFGNRGSYTKCNQSELLKIEFPETSEPEVQTKTVEVNDLEFLNPQGTFKTF